MESANILFEIAENCGEIALQTKKSHPGKGMRPKSSQSYDLARLVPNRIVRERVQRRTTTGNTTSLGRTHIMRRLPRLGVRQKVVGLAVAEHHTDVFAAFIPADGTATPQLLAAVVVLGKTNTRLVGKAKCVGRNDK